MAGRCYSEYFESDLELTLPSSSRRNSRDSDTSWASTVNGTLKGSNSLLSCSESELSVRTGSTAYKRLPPRPAPPPPPPKKPPPPPKKPANQRTVQPKVYSPLCVETPAPFSTLPSISGRNKSLSSKTLSLKEKPKLARTLSSEMSTTPQPFSLPVDRMSRTFSSDGLRHILYSLPPAYPPPPPPESPPLPGYATVLRSTPPTSSTPLVPTIPPFPSRFEQRPSPTGKPMAPSSTQTSECHQSKAGRSNDRSSGHSSSRSSGHSSSQSSCHSIGQTNDHSNEQDNDRGKCSSSFNMQCLCFISCLSFILSFACCFFTAYHFIYHGLLPQQLRICLPRDSFENYNILLEDLITSDKTQYCATSNDELSDLIHAMFITLKNVSESRNVSMPKFQPVSAHVHFQESNYADSNTGTGNSRRLAISKPGNHSNGYPKYHASHVSVTKDALKINQSGTYFVYSSMYHKSNTETTKCEIWSHDIVLERSSNAPDVILAHSAHTCSSDCGADEHSSYTGGIFQLQMHDQVYVNVTSDALVLYDVQGSYLGLVMIAESMP